MSVPMSNATDSRTAAHLERSNRRPECACATIMSKLDFEVTESDAAEGQEHGRLWLSNILVRTIKLLDCRSSNSQERNHEL